MIEIFDAGSAVFTLTGRVIQEPFERYGKLVDVARANKEHMINLGAITQSAGFDKFQAGLDRIKQSTRDFVATAKASFDSVTGSTTKMAVGADRDLGVVQKALVSTSRGFVAVDDTAKNAADSVWASQFKIQQSVGKTAEEYKGASDEIVRSNEKIVESNRAAAGSAGGGAGGGPGHGRGGGAGGGGPFGPGQERQAKKTTAAWKEGANTLANLGKWTTIAAAGVGILSIKWAADFNRQMELVRTQVGYSQKDVQTLSKAVLNLAPRVGVGPDELAKGLYHVTSVLQGQGGTIEAMRILRLAAEGAKVGMANMEDVSSALMAIYKSSPKDIHSVGEAMGVMNDIVGQGNLRMEDLSKALGTGVLAAAINAHIGLRDLGAALDTMTSRGVPAQMAATRLRTTLTLMATPTTKAQKALAELGLSQTQLAEDMQKHGLVYALEDLQHHLNTTFPPGRKLTVDQERQALMQYGQQLEAAGVSGKALEKDLALFKKRLEDSGSSAIQQSQIITSAFGGSRMGTTMALLMQNIDDVHTRFDKLNKANAAGRFQQAWQATQKEFSVQAGEMWAGVQKLGIQLGDWLIPKVKALVTALISAGHWLGRHKILADALAVAFGTVLTAAVVAFFGRFLLRTGEGLKAIGSLGKYIGTQLPKEAEKGFKWLLTQLGLVKVSAEEAGGAVGGVGTGMGAGGGSVGGAAEGALGGPLLGLITGVRGPEAPGSVANPLAVVVMASEALGVGAQGAALESKTSAMARSEATQAEAAGQMTLFGRGAAPAAGEAAAVAPAAESAGMMGMLGGGLKGIGGRLMGGLGIAGMGVMGAQLVGSVVGGKAGSDISTIGSTTAAGAGIGTMIAPGLGTAIGAGLGAAAGIALKIFGSGGGDYGKQIADTMTKGFGGEASKQLRANVAKALDDGKNAATTSARAANFEEAGLMVAQQLEKGWNQFKFQDEPTMFKQFKAEVKKLPPFAQGAAATSAILFAKELEKEGRLPAGSAKKMLHQVEEQFPGFVKYLGLQGKASMAQFNAALNFRQTQQNVKTAMHNIAMDFPQVQHAMNTTKGTVVDQSVAMVAALRDIQKHGSGPASKQASADIRKLQGNVATYLSSLDSFVQAKTADLAGGMVGKIAGATNTVNKNFWGLMGQINKAQKAGLETTKQGSTLIAEAMDKMITALGGTKVSIPKLASTVASISPSAWSAIQSYSATAQATYNVSSLGHTALPGSGGGGTYTSTLGVASGLAAGGYLPGGEFGRGDVMTLVDPQGRPRAKMAGDEAVFNRHQMPFVEAGLHMLGFRGAEDLWGNVNTAHSAGYEKGGKLPGFATGGYIYPFVGGTTIGRADQGVDANMPVGSPIGPIGPSQIKGIIPNWYQGQPFVWWQLLTGPRKGQYAYVSEQINIRAHPGQILAPNQAVATYAPSGTGIEYGWATASGSTLARATTGYQEGQQTPAGLNMRAFLGGLQHGKILGGGALGGMGVWTPISQPKVQGSGHIADLARQALSNVTVAANRRGESQTMGMTGAGFSGGGDSVANEKLGMKMMLASPWHWGMNQWPYLQQLWTKESNWQTTIANRSSGAYGIPQSLPANKMASAGADWRTNPATQIAWGLNYIHSTYGSPQAAWGHETANNWYNRGGWLSHFARGGRSPWSPLPSGILHIPGYRPVRIRRGTGGLHTVGGSTGRGSRGVGRGGRGRATAHVGGGKTSRIGMTQAVANTLKALGFSDIADADNILGNLDNLYQNQESLFTTFELPTGLTPQQLGVLMGIREQEWDLVYPLWHRLPTVTKALQTDVEALSGKTVKGHWHKTGPRPKDKTWVPARQVGGVVPNLTEEVTDVEDEITKLQHDLQLDSRGIATVHHDVTGETMQLADAYASEIAGYTTILNQFNDQKYRNSQSRISLQSQVRNLPSAGGSGLSLGSVVSGVMAGTLPATGSAAASSGKKSLQNRIAALHANDLSISHKEQIIREHLHELITIKNATARRLRQHGFDVAWAITLKKWKVQDKIFVLRQTLKKLKASLKQEEQAAKQDAQALQVLENAQSGGLQGSQSIAESVEGVAMNILDLYQQGAKLPTPYPARFGRKAGGQHEPKISTIASFLKAMGLQLPPGLASGKLQADTLAAAAFQDFLNFQASRAALFSQFGSNFVGAGVRPQASTAAVGAGTEFFGAAAGPEAGLGAPGGTHPGFARGGRLRGSVMNPGNTTWHFENHFAAGPPDPHTWSSGMAHEVRAMM